MAEAPLRIEYEYFPDPTRGRPVSNGAVYVGLQNADPTVLGNRVDVVLIQQNGNRVTIQPSAQPFGTTPGGVIEYQGSPAIIRVDGTVSIAVHDALGSQVYYNPSANQSITTGGGSGSGSTGALLQNGSFEIETVPGIPDNWTLLPASNGTIAIDNTNQSHGFKSLKFTSASAAGAGIATSDRFNVGSNSRSDIRFSLQSTSANVLNIVEIRYYDVSGNVLTTNTVYSEGGINPIVFAQLLVTDLAPASAVEAEIILTGVSSGGAITNGSTWFDDVSVDNVTGTYLVGENGKVIVIVDQLNSVNNVQITSGSNGISPSIDQIGADDLGILIENVLIKDGIVTGDLAGDVAGTADNVVTNADLVGQVTSSGNNTLIANDIVSTTHYKKPSSGAAPTTQVIKNVTPGAVEMLLVNNAYPSTYHFVNGIDINDFRHINIGTVLIPGTITVLFLYRTLAINLSAEVRIMINGQQVYIFNTLSLSNVLVEQDLSVNVGDNITLQARTTNLNTTGRISAIRVAAFEKNFAIA